MENKNYELMVNGNLKRTICILAIPAIISMLVTALYNAADTYFVSKLGESAVAGVSVVMSYMSVVQACGFFFGHGSGNFISQSLGKKDNLSTEKMAVTGVLYSFLAGLILMALSLVFIDPICSLFSSKTMLAHTKNYFLFVVLATPFMTSSFTLNNQLRFQGNAFYGMFGLGTGAVLNIILDPILISVTGDVRGASLATMISQIVGFILLFAFTFNKKSVRLKIKRISFEKLYIAEITKGGMPSLIRQGMMAIASACLSLMVKGYGDFAVAGVSIASKISWIFFSILIGFCQGFQPVCGFNYGAGRIDRVKKAFWFSTAVVTAYMIIACAVCLIFPSSLVELFNTAGNTVGMEKAVAVAKNTLIYQALAFPLGGLYTMSSMMMQNIRRPIRASILAMMRQGIAYIPCVLLLPSFCGLTGVMLSQTVADIVSFVVCLPILISVLKELSVGK